MQKTWRRHHKGSEVSGGKPQQQGREKEKRNAGTMMPSKLQLLFCSRTQKGREIKFRCTNRQTNHFLIHFMVI